MWWKRGQDRTLVRSLCLVTMVGILSGCVGLSEKVAQKEAARQLGKFGEITVVEGEIALFRDCLKERGGTCSGEASTPLAGSTVATAPLQATPANLCDGLTQRVDGLSEGHPARVAKGVLEHPLFGKLVAIHDHLRGLDTAGRPGVQVENAQRGSTVTVDTSLPEIRGFADQVHRATASGGWQSLSAHATEYAGSLAEDHPKKKIAGRDQRTLAFIEAYLGAYFEQGRFVQVELDTGRVQGEVDRYLAQELPWLCSSTEGGAKRCGDLVQKVTEQILKGAAPGSSDQDFMLLTLGSDGFVSRDNRGYRFPGFEVTLDPSGAGAVQAQRLDYTAIGSDLVAVFLEAVFDAHEGLPAVPNATGVQLGRKYAGDALAVFDPATGNVDAADFTRIAQVSGRADAAVGSVVDRAIRGIGPLSLNNVALEQLVTVAVSTTVHKVVSKAAWCWYSCDLDQDLKKEEDRLGQAARDKLYEGSHWVKLRLRIGES